MAVDPDELAAAAATSRRTMWAAIIGSLLSLAGVGYTTYQGSITSAATSHMSAQVEQAKAVVEQQKALLHYRETICSDAFALLGDEKPNPALGQNPKGGIATAIEQTVQACNTMPRLPPVVVEGQR